MITFACSACQKKLSVKEELAGKKGKCPGCGQGVAIPIRGATAAAIEEMPTMPPSLAPESSGRHQRSNGLTRPPPSNPAATQGGNKPDAGHDPGLTDFLSPPQAADELGRLGKYRILKILGHGGMGVVFQAEDPQLKRSVAVKAMLPILAVSDSAGKRFLREAQAMAAVKHDHIVTIYQVDEERGVPFLAMEFLAGEPLDQRLKREAKPSLAEVLRIGREMAEGLAAAHATGLIHRDIKPANIWLEAPTNRVKILDFGLARAVSEDSSLTQQGAIMGTPAFMSPEQGRGEAVDARCDLFSLGVVLYRLCTGHQPFNGKDTIATLMEVALHQPPPPIQVNAEIPQALSDLVMNLLEKDPDRRPASAGVVVEMVQALERKRPRQHDSLAETVALKGAVAPRRRRLLLVLAGVLLLCGLIGAGAFALIRIQSDRGDYVIDTDDPDFSFQVSKGVVTLEDRKTTRKYALKVVRQDKGTGEHELEVADADAGLSFKTKTFTIKRGEKVALKAWFERKQGTAAKKAPAEGEAWLKLVAAMPAAKQVEAVAAKLKECNPGFDGKVTPGVQAGVVTELAFFTDNVTDLSPVRALTGLRTLKCNGRVGRGQLADLSPLKDMKLTDLDCHDTKVFDLLPLKDMKLTDLNCVRTRVSDLTPLKDMKLTTLHCGANRVSDLSPLKDMKLTYLGCGGTPVSDLSPLKDMKLTSLNCWSTRVSDLSPLKEMKLTSLNCGRTQVSNLTPLKDMKLTELWCNATKVSDLSPLKDMKLTSLNCGNTRVADLSPLRGTPLKELICNFKPERDAEILRAIKTLEKINGKPAKEFWQEVDAKKP